MRASRRKYKDDFDHERHIGYLRWRAQAKFRDEPVELSMEDWFQIWTKDFWLKRGRGVNALCLARVNPQEPWRRGNLVLIDRRKQLTISNRRNHDIPVDDVYKQALWKDYE